MTVAPDSTDVTSYFALRLAATGAEATGLTITDFDLQYVRSGATPAAKVDATALAAVNSAHGDNQAIEVDATDQPGLYRVDWPDAAFAAGVREVVLTVKCATVFTEHLRVELKYEQTGDAFARLGAPAGASVAADIAAADDATLAAIAALNDLSAAQVNAEVDTALADIHLDHLLATVYDPAAKPGAADALLNELVGSDAGVSQFTANALELAPTGGSAPTAGEIADAVWDEALAGHQSAGSAGEALEAAGTAGDPWTTALPGAYGAGTAGSIIGNNIDAAVSTRATPAQVNTEVDTALADARLDELLIADSDIDGAAPPTVGSVFHELMSKTAGSFTFDQTTDSLEAVRDNQSAAAPSPATIADAVWDEARGDHTSAGSFGQGVASVQGDVTGAVASVTGAVASVTGNVGGNLTGSIGSLAAQAKADVNAEVDTALAEYDAPTHAELTAGLAAGDDATLAAIAALNDLSAAQVNAEVDTALADARLDELLAADSDIDGAAPPVVGSVFHELMSKTTGSFTFNQTTDSLEAVRDNQAAAAPTALAIADAVWDEARADHTAAGSFGQGVASVQAGVTVTTNNDKTGYALSAAGVQAVWDALTSALTGAGSIGKKLADWALGSDNRVLVSANAHTSGETVAAVTGAVGSVTGNVDGSVASVAGAVGSVTGSVGGNVTGSVGSLSTQAKADVNAEIVDALGVDTIPELAQAVPPATPTIKQALAGMWMAFRNEGVTTNAERRVKNDAGTVVMKQTRSDDGTTSTLGKMEAGP